MSTFTTGTTQQGLWNYIENGQTHLVVEALKKDPAQLKYTTGHNQDTPLHVIAASSNTEMLKAVIAVIDPRDIDIPNKNGATALMSAGVNARADNADVLMEAGANVNAATVQGETLLTKTLKGRGQDDVRESEKPVFDRIIETAVVKFGAKIDARTLDTADTFEDTKNYGFLEKKMQEQKAAPPKPAPSPKTAPVSKFA